MTKDAYFSLLTRTKQLLLVTLYDSLQVLKLVFGRTEPDGQTDGRTDERTDGQTDVEVEIVI